MVAEIIIQSNARGLNRIFDYEIPKDMESKIKIGSRVFVPFGNRKELEDGFVIGIKDKSEYKLREIAKMQEELVLSIDKIELAKWMSKRYFCNLSDCLKLMLAPGTTNKIVSNRIKEKNVNFITLSKNIEDIEQDIENKKVKSDKQIRTLKFVMENGEVLVSDLEMFADTTNAVINTLCKNGYLKRIEKQVDRNPFKNKNIEKTSKLKLNKEQKLALDTILNSAEDMMYSEFLIFGVTGSRKN